MSHTVEVIGLGKAYRHYPDRWTRLAEWLLPFGEPRHQQSWALRDVSFTVSPGEAVGIVGFNGAGKSTLLRIITGTTRATEGEVRLHGRVAALLELGMGFHGEFTGRQNVMMNGQLLGLERAELEELMPAIEDFAEIGAYFDEPLRTYSSGMAMRLAFSLATARRPELLIVDEALSVGDAYFQHKSFSRIREFREQGTTLLIVSHDRLSIQALCDRAILLHEGRLLREGEPEIVMDFYHALMADRTFAHIRQELNAQGVVQTTSGTGEATIVSVTLQNAGGANTDAAKVGEEVVMSVRFRVHVDLPSLVVGLMIKDRLGHEMFGINSHRLSIPIENLAAGSEHVFRLRFQMDLGEGHYSVTTALTRSDAHVDRTYEWRDRALIFYVINVAHPRFVGCNWLAPVASLDAPEDAAMTADTGAPRS
ncbi:MAG: ABC transporter ATP-binding protein [Pseudomonadales bacterium]|nr:ABC transporter ATP-binding protein [Pseudomonadales bacterium]MBP7911382.1 ABC transporter ATP-binding protein [Pseudomonadales bacterium]